MPVETQKADQDSIAAQADASRTPAATAARQSSTAQISSVLALAISVLALAVGTYQTRVMQAQARASVWPYLTVGFSHFGAGDNAGFTWQIDNNGVGPAKIEAVTLSLDDKPMRSWKEVYAALGLEGHDYVITASVNGEVLPPNTNRETTIRAIQINRQIAADEPGKARQQKAIDAFFAASGRFKMSVCYCSVYDECWTAQWLKRTAQPVTRCEADGVQFDQ